ncbi:gluconokinase [Phycicoccus sp. CSK15P-2]|nr:gluconokinase [Phycicoccus sp. CSK15P-2]
MGPSGSGKSALAARLADVLGWPMVDADDLHPAANVEKMRSGVPLTDADRWPWLDAVGAAMRGRDVVVACSALRRAHRDRLREAEPEVRFVALAVPVEELERRMTGREHFMPPALLRSQLEAFEPLEEDEPGTTVENVAAPDDVVDDALRRLHTG